MKRIWLLALVLASASLAGWAGLEAYRKIYSDVITPRRVAEMLVLRDDVPRSLHSCMNLIDATLGELAAPARNDELLRLSGELHARLHYGRTEDMISVGLHEYLMDFLERISALGAEINRRLLVPAD